MFILPKVQNLPLSDSKTLENRLDSVESEKKSFQETLDELTAKNIDTMKEEFKNLEKKYKKNQRGTSNYERATQIVSR